MGKIKIKEIPSKVKIIENKNEGEGELEKEVESFSSAENFGTSGNFSLGLSAGELQTQSVEEVVSPESRNANAGRNGAEERISYEIRVSENPEQRARKYNPSIESGILPERAVQTKTIGSSNNPFTSASMENTGRAQVIRSDSPEEGVRKDYEDSSESFKVQRRRMNRF